MGVTCYKLKSNVVQNSQVTIVTIHNRHLVSLVGRVLDCVAGGRRVRASDRTNTQGLKITEENVLPL